MVIMLQSVRIQSLSISSKMAAQIRAGQIEAGKAWTLCRDQLKQAMSGQAPWPNRDSLQKAIKGQFGLHSQSAQMVTHAFLANVDTARQLRKSGRKEIRYPYRDKHFYPLLWPAQAMCLKGDSIILPMGRGRPSLVFDRPDWLVAPAACKVIWNRTGYELHVSIETPPGVSPGSNEATIDLGQIHQCAVTTSTGQGLIVSGRGIRSEKQRMNKMHGALAAKQSRCKKGSRRWKKLNRARNAYALRSERRIRDLRHKGTRQTIDFCVANEVGSLFIGDPHGVRTRRCGKKHNQRMSQWEYGKDTDYLQQKAVKAGISSFTGSERGTSSRCPICSHRHKPTGRNWACKACDFIGHRDLVGSANMHEIAFGHKTMFPAAQAITYLRPGTAAMRVLDGCSARTRSSRSNRPDTGHGEVHVAARKCSPSTTRNALHSGAPKGAGQGNTPSSEAHSL